MTMNALIDFLKNRFRDDERIALAAYAGPWVVQRLDASTLADGNSADVIATDQTRDGWGIAVDDQGFGACAVANAEHIAHHDPARILREVAAKRRILDEVVSLIDGLDMSVELDRGIGSGMTGESDLLLLLLALPYRDHPDYLPEWAR